MKAIAGIAYPDIFQMNDLISPMLQALTHRCQVPESDTYQHKNIEIGICGGKLQANKNQSVIVGMDGYLSNHESLRQVLQSHGYHFYGKEMEELIVHGYEHWDTEIFSHLIGEFSIAILDQRKKRVFLCRDRIGKKPLYWYHNNQTFIFASELKALLATGAVPQTPALDALSSYLYFGYIPQDMTPIKDVNKLLPAHYLEFHFDGNKSIHSYWSYSSNFEKTNQNPLPKIIEELDHLIDQSIQESITSDEKVGCFLSGGLGSATIAQYAAKYVPADHLAGYTVGLLGHDDEKVEEAQTISQTLGISHQTYTITSESFLNDLVSIAWHLDEPLSDPHVISTWNLAALASKHSTNVLSGVGSDELFADHRRYTIEEQGRNLFKRSTHKVFRSFARGLIPFFNTFYKPLAYRLIKDSRVNPLQHEYLTHNALFSESEIQNASPQLGGIFDPDVFLHKFHHLNRIQSTVSSYLYFDVKTRLPDLYLIQYERLTAAHHLNWRAPFLSSPIVEFLATLPEPDFLREKETGSYLKPILEDHFPESLIKKPKKIRNFEIDLELKEVFKSLLEGTLVETGLLSKRWLHKKIKIVDADPNAFNHLWTILMLELWFRLFINQPVEPTPPKVSIENFLSL